MGFEIDHITEIMYSTDGGKTYQPLPGYLPTVNLETICNQKYEAVVKYMAITAMYDMMLSDEQVPLNKPLCKETIAFANRMRNDLGITLKDIHDIVSNNHFTTQGWINEYYRIQAIGYVDAKTISKEDTNNEEGTQ